MKQQQTNKQHTKTVKQNKNQQNSKTLKTTSTKNKKTQT